MASHDQCKRNKVVLVGDFGVGKTTIFTRFKTGKAEGVDLNTRKECEFTKHITVDGRSTCITLYDTAGMERFEGTIPPTYFRSAKAVIFVYSIGSAESINDIESWMESVSPQRLEFVGNAIEIIRIMVGNKVDLADTGERNVERERGLNVAEQFDIDQSLFFEISALEGTGFDELFEAVVREIRKTGDSSSSEGQTLKMPPAKTSGKSGCCN